MVGRRWVGSWLGGPRSAGVDLGYPGERLGLPTSGRGSVVGFGRRLLAFAVDAVLCDLVAVFVFHNMAWNIVVFFAEVWVLTGLLGYSAGQLICGIRVARLDGKPVGPLWSFVRTALLCLLIPAVIWDRDYRGLHDRAANTVVVQM